MEHQEYPKMLYYKGDATNQKTVTSAEEEDKLGADWIDAPVADYEAQTSIRAWTPGSGFDPAGTEKDKDDSPAPITSTGPAPGAGKKR